MKDQPPVNDIDRLIERVASYTSSKNGESLLRRAYQVAFEVHDGFERINGEPYINHTIAVASILTEWGAPLNVVVAGLLHDIINPDYSRERRLDRLQSEFEPDIYRKVEEVSSLSSFVRHVEGGDFYSEAEAEDFRYQIASFLGREPDAVVIKIADRLHNLQTASSLTRSFQERMVGVVLNLLIPLADRLGMAMVKRQLEDCCFEINNPVYYRMLQESYIDANFQQQVECIEEELHQLVSELVPSSIVRWQPASLYEIGQEIELGKLMPTRAVTIPLVNAGTFITLVEDEDSCFPLLGRIHKRYLPVKGQIHNFIADPKENGYQSLDTQVKYTSGQPLQIAIRTLQMDLISEYGMIAAWRGIPRDRLPSLPLEMKHTNNDIQVYTPKGEIKYLLQGATVLDFAYSIHSEVGHHCLGALVNGERAELHRVLTSGDRIQIISGGPDCCPNLNWLDYARTPQALSRIRQWLTQHRKEDLVQRGQMLLDTELQPLGWDSSNNQIQQLLMKLASKKRVGKLDDLLVAISLGRLRTSKVVENLKSTYLKSIRTSNYVEPTAGVNVLCPEAAQLSRTFAKCCGPQPPEDIVGFRRSDGVLAIHKRSCTQLVAPEKQIQVKWDTTSLEPDYVIVIETSYWPGLAGEIETQIALSGINMQHFSISKRPDGVTAEARIYLSKTTSMQRSRVQRALEGARYVHSIEFIHSSMLSNPGSPLTSFRVVQSPNPYGPRLAEGSRFYGREAECERVANMLRSSSESTAILLWGQKRIGKTSFVLRLKEQAQGDFLPVYIDMQGLKDSSTTQFLHELMLGISHTLLNSIIDLKREMSVTPLHRLRKDPLAYFDSFMTVVEEVIEDHTPLVVILDEFQCLCSLREEEVKRDAIFSRLRSRSLHRRGMRLVLSGGGLISQLTQQGDISSLFNISYDEKLGALEAKAARRLIKDGLTKVGSITDLAIDLLLDLTACHPFYLQLLCSKLFEQAKEHRVTITQQMVMQNVQEWLNNADSGRFIHLWEGYDAASTQKNKLILCAIAQLTSNEVEYSRLADVLCPTMPEHELIGTLEDLTSLGIIRRDHLYYAIEVKLFTRWLKKQWPLEVALKEASWL
jgi:GTP diphosphokinase / guanosine-3',5'-bis(diphosphate) 3'-diphosphatase